MDDPAVNAQRATYASGAAAVVVTRYKLWLHVLTTARAGALPDDWRTTLSVEQVLYEHHGGRRPPAAAASTEQCDTEELALHEIVTSPPAAWEPYEAGGDWQQALKSWYRASLDVLDTYEAAQNRTWGELRASAKPQAFPESTSLGAALRKTTLVDGFLSTFQRDSLGAQYRAGLAAGGECVDWVDWYREKIEQWDVTGDAKQYAGMKQKMLTEVTTSELRMVMEKLPPYWTQAGR